LQQLGNPLTIDDVGLPPRHLLEVLGIDQQDREPSFPDVEDRLPINSGGFPGDDHDALVLPPLDPLASTGCRGREAADVFLDSALGTEAAPTRPDRRRVDIQTGTAGVNHLETSVPGSTSSDPRHEATSGW